MDCVRVGDKSAQSRCVCDVEWAVCQLPPPPPPGPPQVNPLPQGSTWYLADFIHLCECV